MKPKRVFPLILTLLLIATMASANVTLPKIIGDNMVLQRDRGLPIWGWADPGEEVTVEFAGQTVTAKADETGEWSVKLKPLKASAEPRTLSISSSAIGNKPLTLSNVLVGDVWICSGQSNMEYRFNGKGEDYKNDLVHLFRVAAHTRTPFPLPDVNGSWTDYKSGQDVGFSGVGLFFGCELQAELGVPIGLIDTSWGGTAIEPWISDEGYEIMGKPIEGNIEDALKEQDRIVRDVKSWVDRAEAGQSQSRIVPFAVNTQIRGNAPNQIYNGMVAGMVPYGVKGFTWYQGESNRGSKFPDYLNKLQGLVGGWRRSFNVPDAPFYLVQIAPFDYNRGNRKADDTVLCNNIWAAQYKAAEEIDECGIIPTHDTINGNVKNIHPRDKKTVGERLAALALSESYGKEVTCSGPVVDKVRDKNGKIEVSFDMVDEGLETADGKPPSWFELSADGKTWVKANAEIDGDTVLLSSTELPEPKLVRMGWSEVAIPNLRDKNGWPAFQFGPTEIE